MNKRKDAQGLRGWAVLLVILFQFYPVVFPNSFIGLDIYFVTAGFIVAIILSRYDSFNIDNAKEFLLKRAQRILPMYYIAMILILLVVGVALPLSYKKLNLETARKSVFLTANFYNREPGMMVLSMLFHFSTSEPLFHKCVFSRLWQFFAGFLAFSIGDKGHKPEFDGTDFKSVDQLAGSNVKQLDGKLGHFPLFRIMIIGSLKLFLVVT
ncbi:unnamed protein product [Nippostrongylus brasiliensis]|uniref:Acyl_transf_3 domain-containing protein n=1 Tax=Nippostrongylus brasiliensis TaxID=27835 RepID=A0A0N4YDK6_NIPBR|nr:unnamed protein product [Nippostrongylus brasiliensis]